MSIAQSYQASSNDLRVSFPSVELSYVKFANVTHFCLRVPMYNCIPTKAKIESMKTVRIMTSRSRRTASSKAPTMVFKPRGNPYCYQTIIYNLTHNISLFILINLFHYTSFLEWAKIINIRTIENSIKALLLKKNIY